MILAVFGLALPCFAQKGFKLITKAELKYEQGKNTKALKLLSKAENMNYGFCGNAWMDASFSINLLRVKIHFKNNDYQAARDCLDSVNWRADGDYLDSIRIRTYQMEFGKDSLSKMIDVSLVSASIECGDYYCYFMLALTNGKSIKFTAHQITSDLTPLYDEMKLTKDWVKRFKESANYTLIKEKG